MFAFVDQRVYYFVGFSGLAADRPMFDAFLSTIRFHPEDAVE